MLRPSAAVQVYLYPDPVDMRKSIDGLSALVEVAMDLSPFEEALFVFCNRGCDKIKILLSVLASCFTLPPASMQSWERNGFIVWYKRLEKQRFYWNRTSDGVIELDGLMLNNLLDGLDIWRQNPHKRLHFDSVL